MEFMTASEKEQLETRLRELHEFRPKISERIAEARALGDLKENSEYHAAREEQGMQEAEIRRLEEKLKSVAVVDDSHAKDSGVVFVGATVRIREEGDDETELVRLVGEASSNMDDDVFEATLSSPMGEALLKARIGEVVAVRGPRGVKRFEILEIV